MLNKSDRPAQFQNCGQNKFEGATNFQVLASNEATDKWYGGKKHYNFAAGKPYYESHGDVPEATLEDRGLERGVKVCVGMHTVT